MKLKQFIFALVAMLSSFAFTANAADGNVAKVGDTEYATIDEALKNWTAGSTLTLLANVTLPDVVKINSNESRTLDLGTFTMTAASGKDAFQYVVKGCTTDVGLSIKADATNPGGITATGKAIIRHAKPILNAPAKDRPYTQFFGGVFNASYIVYQGSNTGLTNGYTGASAPRFVFHGGVFNGTIYANRSKFIFNGGTFNGNIQISVDSSADALVKGGKFKNLSNSFGSALNTDKFTIGSAEGVYDRGIYVDAKGYYVITSAPITEVSAKYPAVKKESYNSNNYFYYSAAATYGMFYEVASEAGTGSNVTLWEPVKAPAVEEIVKPEASEEEKAVVEEVIAEVINNAAVKNNTVELPAEVVDFAIELAAVEVAEETTPEAPETPVTVVTEISYTVTPSNAAGEKVSKPSEPITFRLPLPSNWASEKVKVFHNGTALDGDYEVKTVDGANYVEVESQSFSTYTVQAIVPVAKIGETPYATLAEAVAAAGANETITLLADVTLAERVTIPANKTLTIDLNGKFISMEESIIATAYAINNLGNLTITDGVGGGSINARGVYNGYGDGGANVTSATITVSGGTFNAKGTNGGAAIFNYGTANVNGGKFTSIGGYSLNNQAGAKMNITDGVEVTGGIYNNQDAELTVDGGNISNNRSGCHTIYAWNAKVTVNGGSIHNENSGNATIMSAGTSVVTINGGTISIKDGRVPGNGNTWTSCLTDAANTAQIIVNDGTLNGGVRVQAGATMTINGGSFNDVYGSNYNIYGTVTVTGGTFTDDTAKKFATKYVAEGYELNADGTVAAKPVAEVNGTKYASFAEAAAAANAGSEIKLLANIEGDITVPAGVTFNGNGFAVSGAVTAAGEITFKNVTKVGNFGVQYVNTTVNIPDGASLQLTGTGRMVIGHGCTFNITGTITDAKDANVADVTPSLVMPGASFTGAGVTFNVTNAYISAPSSYCSSSKSASGTFDFNITNSIWESAGKLAFEEQSVNAKVDFALVNSVLTTGSHLVFGTASGEEGVVIDNSYVNKDTSRQLENCGTMTIKNGSVVNGAVATSSNAKNPGTVIVENATYAVTGEFSGSDLGTGTLIIKKDANVSVGSITKANIVIDAADMTAGELANFTANLSGHTGTLSVINNDKLEAKIVDGKVVLAAKPVAKIGEQGYATLAAAVNAAQASQTIELLADVAIDEVTVAKSITINGNGHKVTPADTTKTYNSAFMVGDSGWGDDHGETITINNVVFEGWKTNYGVVRAQGVTLNMDGCEFNGNSVSNAAYAVLSLNYTDATVKNSKFVGNDDRAIDVNYNADGSEAVVTVYGCTFDGNSTDGAGIIYKNAGDVKVLNSTFVNNTVSTNGNAATVYTGWGDGDEVVGCTFTNNTVTTSHATTKRFASAIFCDGCVVSENVFGEGNTATRNGESISTIVAVGAYYGAANISANYWGAAPEKGKQYTIEYTRNEVALNSYYKDAAKTELYTYPVAKIGDVEYTLLQDAIDAVKEGETIILVDDVNVTTPAYGQNALNHAKAVSFTLDLNGKTLSANTGNSVFRFNIANSGATSDVTLTIKNGTVVADSNTWCAVMASGISADVKAIMNLEDLTIESSKAGDLAVKAWANATINAKNVTVNTTNAAGGFYACGGEIVLDNCTVNQKGLHTAPYLSMAFAVSTNGKMTVNSGTYSAEPTAAAEGSNQGSTHGSWVGGVMNSGGELIINGGTFSNGNFGDDALATAARGLIFADSNGKVTVNGGTFNALKSIFDFQNNLGTISPVITVKGGNYSADPAKVTSYGSIVLAEDYIVVENNGVWNVELAAAKIGKQGYATIKDAVAAVQEGETITILAGTHSEGTIKLPATLKNVTIKGAEGAELKDMTISAADGNSVNYDGLTFDGITFDNSNVVLTGWRTNGVVYKNITVNGCTFKNIVRTNNEAAFHINCDAKEAVNGFTFTNNIIDGVSGASNSGIYAQLTGEVKVEGNVINNVAFRPYVIQVTTDDGVADNFTVTGNTFSGSSVGRAQGLGNNAEGTDNVNLVVSNNIFKDITGAQQICYWNFNAEKTTADLSGNYYDIDIVANPGKIYFNSAAENTADLTNMGIFPIYTELNADGTINIESAYYPPVAKIGETTYASLAEAVAAAQAGEVIVLIADVKTTDGVVITDKNLTIDLNGKTYTVTEGASTNNRNFKINGTSVVTVKNGTMVAAGEYSSGAYGTVRTEGTANVTLTGLKLYNYRGNGLNIKACAGTTVTIENTEIYANYGGGIESAGGTIVVNNGVTVEQKGMYTAPYNSMAISVNGGGKVTVNGGTFSTECITAEEANNQGTSHGPWVAGVLNSGGTLIINGGTFSNDNFGENSLATAARGAILADTKAKVEINGGEFNVLKNVIDIQNNLGDANNNPSVVLAGGTYNADPRISAQYGSNLITLAEDYIAVENNGVWNVVKAAAKIGGVGYATLEAAFKAATSGCTIEILSDVTVDYAWDCRYTGSKFTVPVTINGNGHTIKFTNTVYDGGNHMSAFRFEADATVNNLTIDMSEALSGFAGRFRAISAKGNLTVDGCTFIGNGSENNTRAIIFGEGASTAENTIAITNSTFNGWRRGISDSESGNDVAANVTVTGNTLDDAAVYVSATENVTFKNNTVNANVDIRSYTADNTLNVTATDNTLAATEGVEYKIKAGGTINAQNEFVVPAKGSNSPAYTGKDENGNVRVWGEGGGNAKESFELKLYAGETLVATSKLNNIGGIIDGDVYVTWNFFYPSSNDEYWTTTWEVGHPNSAAQPTTLDLVIDGTVVATTDVQMNAADNLFPVKWAELGGVQYICTGLAGEGTEANPYLINRIEDLAWFRDDVNAGNNYSRKFVKLAADINLNNEEWEPIGYMGKSFVGNFDGGNFTISNLKVAKALTNASANNGVGLFGRVDSPATIKDLTIENATVTGSLYVGALVGYAYTGNAIENVTVKGNIAINAYWYAGVIGGNGYMNLVNNCHVIGNDGSYIKGNNGSYIGGIWGFRGEGANNITNCTVTNLSIEGVDRVGGISGMAHYGNTISGCAVKNVTVAATDAEATTVGLIAGACQGTTAEPSIITGSTVENVKVTINGAEVEASIFGTNINGETPVTNFVAKIGAAYYETLAEAVAAAQAGETVVVIKDVEVASGTTITLDGVNLSTLDGVTLTNNGVVNVKGEVSLNIVALAGEELNLLDGAIVKNSTVGGSVFVAGNVTFRGANTFAMLYDYGTLTDYYGTTAPMKWTVEEGASVTLTNAARYGLGYGDDVTVYGNIEDALTARENLTDADRSLFMHGLVAQESKGWNCDSKFTVENAYVAIGSNNSFGNKSGNYGGTYTFNIENSVVDASRITFYEALSTTTFTFDGCDVKMGTFMTRDTDSKFTLKNSKVLSTTTTNGNDEGNYNKGELTLVNSSLTYSAELKHEAGVINLDCNSVLTAPAISGAGKITVDATGLEGSVTVINGDMANFAGTIEIVGNEYASYSITDEGLVINSSFVAELEIIDGEYGNYTNAQEITVDTLTYKRTGFPVNTWVSLYVPFEIPVSKLTGLGYDVAYPNDIHFKGAEDDGVVDEIWAEYIKINAGVLKANFPYMIRANNQEATTMELVLEETTLYSTDTEQTVIECSSAFYKFNFAGTYEAVNRTDIGYEEDVTSCFAVANSGNWAEFTKDTHTLNPFRVYMTMTAKAGAPYIIPYEVMKSIGARVVGEENEDGTTVIYDVNAENGEDVIYDLNGRRVLETEKGGLYIINGKKVLVK